MNAGLWPPPDTVCHRIGQATGESLNTTLAEAPDAVFTLIDEQGIQCEAIRKGTLHCAHSKSGLDNLRDDILAKEATAHSVTLGAGLDRAVSSVQVLRALR